ncbi:IS66 family transposase [Chloroflexi bacterium TSY]|nr:IS66 family transposase [Chloroflexi bacterium TSY]
MKQTITTNIAVSYTQCPRKAFLLLSSAESGPPHEYVQILDAKKSANQTHYLDKLAQEKPDVIAYEMHGLESKHRFLTNATLKTDLFEAECGLLTKVGSHSALGHYSYEPTVFVGTHKVSKEQKLALFFTAHVLDQLQDKSPVTGYIVDGARKSHKVKLEERAQTLLHVLEPLQEWLAEDAPEEPPVILNKHCPLCPFRDACRAKAEQENNLSLLDKVTPKIVRKFERKGIFTVTQLSYTFKPRKRKKRAKNPPPVTHKLELQALAIREGKIYIQELPELTRQPVELFLDIEGIPDQNVYYLIGLLVCEGESSTHHSFWADMLADEARIWQQFVDKANEYPDAPIYHYGNYEAKAIKKLAKRYDTDEEQLLKRLVNVNGLIYGKVYFPVYSNRLKEIGGFIGAKWSEPDASGLQSLIWRYYWEENREPRYRNILVKYNQEDCQVLKLLIEELTKIEIATDILSEADFSKRQKEPSSETNAQLHNQLESILKFANFNYDERKISFEETTKGENVAETKVENRMANQRYVRIVPKPNRIVEVRQRGKCPKHNIALQPSEQLAEHTIIDLVFMKNGVRRTVIRYVGPKGYCSKCSRLYRPPSIEDLAQQVFGHSFQCWLVYQRLYLRLPYRIITQMVEDQFGERLRQGTIVKTIRRIAQYYSITNQTLLELILTSPFVHVDETKISIQGSEQWVWVFTDGRRVHFRLTETREADIVHDVLSDYKGILISDFYTGYDSVKCEQQKCWVHLIRDLNDDLWDTPFDAEFELFVLQVKGLIIPIMQAVQKYGLKKRNLNKFNKQVRQFYKTAVIHRHYRSELTQKYQNRFIKYQESLFTFLEHDGVSWHNNAAERALRHLAVQRKISGSFGEGLIHEYLLLLGLMQTCRFQNKSFLKFLLSQQKDIDKFRGPKPIKNTRLVGDT